MNTSTVSSAPVSTSVSFDAANYKLFKFNKPEYDDHAAVIRSNNNDVEATSGSKTYVLCLDIEKISEIPNEGVSAIGYCVRQYGVHGRIVTSGCVALPFVCSSVTPYQMDDFFSKPWNEGLFDKWLVESIKSFETYAPIAGLDQGDINNEEHRNIVSSYLLRAFVADIDQLQLDLKAQGCSMQVVSDYTEFDIAEVNVLLYRFGRSKPLAFTAESRNEDGSINYAWSGSAINPDTVYRSFLSEDTKWGFGAKLAAKFGVFVPPNKNSHMAEDDATHIATEYCILTEAINSYLNR